MPVRKALAAPDIEVWQMRLDQETEQVLQLEKLLSDDEIARGRRFHAERHRRRFIVSRGALRTLLSHYLSVKPGDIVFGYSSHGKPFVQEQSNHVNFNMSHSGECAIYAVSREYQIGVDIEFLDRKIEFDDVAKRFFEPREYTDMRELPQAVRKRAFMACWTRKEAVVKALGDGLSIPLDQFRVSADPDAPPCVIEISAKHHQLSDWIMHTLDVGCEYYATLAGYRSDINDAQKYR